MENPRNSYAWDVFDKWEVFVSPIGQSVLYGTHYAAVHWVELDTEADIAQQCDGA